MMLWRQEWGMENVCPSLWSSCSNSTIRHSNIQYSSLFRSEYLQCTTKSWRKMGKEEIQITSLTSPEVITSPKMTYFIFSCTWVYLAANKCFLKPKIMFTLFQGDCPVSCSTAAYTTWPTKFFYITHYVGGLQHNQWRWLTHFSHHRTAFYCMIHI